MLKIESYFICISIDYVNGYGNNGVSDEKSSILNEYSETNDGGMTVNIAGDQEGTIVEGSGNEEGINPLWWPEWTGKPQVTNDFTL